MDITLYLKKIKKLFFYLKLIVNIDLFKVFQILIKVNNKTFKIKSWYNLSSSIVVQAYYYLSMFNTFYNLKVTISYIYLWKVYKTNFHNITIYY